MKKCLWGVLFGALALAGPARGADGLTGRYYAGQQVVDNRIRFDGLTLSTTRTNTSFDFWSGSQYYDWNPIGGGSYSVHWTGYLHITNSGYYGFGTISDDGSEIWIDGEMVVDNNEEQWYDWQEGYCYLGAGYHTIEIAFYEAQSFSGIEVYWLKPSAGASMLPYSGDNFHGTPPTYNSGTLWEILSAPAIQTEAPYVNPKLTATVAPEANVVDLTWQGYANVNYTIETSTNLVHWKDIAGPLPGTNALMTQGIGLTNSQAFFRAKVDEL
jgi:hypothetical protein